MLEAMTRKWWVLLVRGLSGVLIGLLAIARRGPSGMLSVIFGIVTIAQPIFGVRTLAYLVGLYASAVGLLPRPSAV